MSTRRSPSRAGSMVHRLPMPFASAVRRRSMTRKSARTARCGTPRGPRAAPALPLSRTKPFRPA
eukprot:917547-Heterocapsa_arctica.AAC.1